MKEVTIQALAKILGLTTDRVSEILFKKSDDGSLTDEVNEDALSQIEDLHADHVRNTSSEALDAKYNEGHKAGKYEALSKVEEDLRKKYGVEGKNLNDVAAAIAAKAAQEAGTEDKVLTHPAYLNLKNNSEAAIEAIKAEYETKFNTIKSEAEKKERFNSKLTAIEAAIIEAGAVLPKNPNASANLKKLFFDHIGEFDFDDKETGTYLKNKDGALLKDKHGHPVTLENYVKSKVIDYFDVELQPARKSPGNEGVDAPTATKWNKDNVPKDAATFEAEYYKISDPKERAEFSQAFEQQNRGSEV